MTGNGWPRGGAAPDRRPAPPRARPPPDGARQKGTLKNNPRAADRPRRRRQPCRPAGRLGRLGDSGGGAPRHDGRWRRRQSDCDRRAAAVAGVLASAGLAPCHPASCATRFQPFHEMVIFLQCPPYACATDGVGRAAPARRPPPAAAVPPLVRHQPRRHRRCAAGGGWGSVGWRRRRGGAGVSRATTTTDAFGMWVPSPHRYTCCVSHRRPCCGGNAASLRSDRLPSYGRCCGIDRRALRWDCLGQVNVPVHSSNKKHFRIARPCQL